MNILLKLNNYFYYCNDYSGVQMRYNMTEMT